MAQAVGGAEMPAISNYARTNTTYSGDGTPLIFAPQVSEPRVDWHGHEAGAADQQFVPMGIRSRGQFAGMIMGASARSDQTRVFFDTAAENVGLQAQFQQERAVPNRIVQVYIADPNPNIPLDQQMLHVEPEKYTDLSDQELYFDIDIKGVLAKHNEKRVKIVNKAVKDRTEYLEPARVRDLKMVVVTIAQF